MRGFRGGGGEEPPRVVEELQEQGEEEEDENEILIAKAQALIEKITSNPENPNPNALHAFSTILEAQESRYMEETGHFSTNNGRSSHNVGRLGNLTRAAATGLLFDCSLSSKHPHVFEDVLDNIKGWVMDGTPGISVDDQNWKHESRKRMTLDFKMLRTYSTSLLAVCLASGGQIVEDVLTSGLSAKLM